MRTKLSVLIIILFIINLCSSCVSRSKLTYLQYSDRNSVESVNSVASSTYRIMPYDNLFIRVITPDPQWSELFNAMPVGSGGAMTEESANLVGYSVDINGNIDIPFVGKVEVGGKTISDIKSELSKVFQSYVTDAAISVRLINNHISIIGEVRSPGRYPLTKDRMNIFEAISMAGDLSDYSDRQKIHLIRQSPYGPVIKEFSLSDRSILSSEYYYILPNDIIYAIPLRGKSFQVNSTIWTLFLTTVTSAFGIIAFFRTL